MMKMSFGLFDGMVVQRNGSGVSCQSFAGSCTGSGDLVASAVCRKGGKSVKGLKSVKIGSASGNKFKGVLKGLPTGGPYDIKLEVVSGKKTVESLTVKNVLVGDVWMLGGQSNMQGCGNACHALKPNPLVRAFYMDNKWENAKDPIHNLYEAAARVHADLMGPNAKAPAVNYKGTGPGVAFAQEMYRKTSVPQGLIASGHGGTSMTQWDPSLKNKGCGSLYGAMLERFRLNGSAVSGMLWYQGCSDANADAAPLFYDRMIRFIKEVRKDFKSPELPFVMVQIGRVVGATNAVANACWSKIRESQRLIPLKMKNVATVPVMDLDLDDQIHISGNDQHVLGKRLAESIQTIRKAKHAQKPQIHLKSVDLEKDAIPGTMMAVVTFDNVIGKLVSGSRPNGFTTVVDNTECQSVFRTELKGNKVLLHLGTNGYSESVAYGYGTDPYCNIIDSAGRSLPAFGPVPSNGKNAYPRTPYSQKAQISEPHYVDETSANMKAENCRGLKFAPMPSVGPFMIPSDREKYANATPKIRYFRTAYECGEDMKIRVLLGYDGPVKLFCDGKPVFENMKGTNPVIPEESGIDLALTKGRHELIVALAINGGAAWGISLRLGRPEKKRAFSANLKFVMPVETDWK